VISHRLGHPSAEGTPERDPASDLARIVPLVRSLAPAPCPLVTRPLAADLQVLYACDEEDGAAPVAESKLAMLAVDAAELHERALENLARLLDDVTLEPAGPIWILACGGRHEASALLLDRFWREVAPRVAGDLVAGCPANDVLLFTGTGVRYGVETLRSVVEKTYAEGGCTISTQLLRWTAAGWQPFED